MKYLAANIHPAANVRVALAASVILAELPELCGVGQEIVHRSGTPETAHCFASLMKA